MHRKLFAAIFLSAFVLTAPALAVGSGDDDDDDDASNDAVRQCNNGEVWDRGKNECVPADQQSLDDDGLFENGRVLAYLGRFEEAVTVLGMIKDQNRPDVLNYLGYATRNAGDLQAGIAHYRRAIALDPNHTLARSYMGQALLLDGDRAGAIAQLDAIETRCGRDCRGYAELAEAIVAATEDRAWRY